MRSASSHTRLTPVLLPLADTSSASQAGRDWLPVLEGEVDTPLGRSPVEFVDPSQPLLVVPILRAGLVLLEQAATVLPSHVTHHFGAARDEVTLLPTVYLNKLPSTIAPERCILVTDPMLATGAWATLQRLAMCFLHRSLGVSRQAVRCVPASTPSWPAGRH